MKKHVFMQEFLDGKTEIESNNLYVDSDNYMVNYNTFIAKLYNGDLYLNKENYSSTTSRNQNLLEQYAIEKGIPIFKVNEIALIRFEHHVLNVEPKNIRPIDDALKVFRGSLSEGVRFNPYGYWERIIPKHNGVFRKSDLEYIVGNPIFITKYNLSFITDDEQDDVELVIAIDTETLAPDSSLDTPINPFKLGTLVEPFYGVVAIIKEKDFVK